MFLFMFFILIAASPLSTSVLKKEVDSCSQNEFSCGDGGCISLDLVCDGSRDCADGGDELVCDRGLITLDSSDTVLHRSRRQSQCRKDQWKCRDGSCIPFHGRCDGVADCADRSDETHALCRNSKCQYNWFRCTYGACVDGTAPCNNIQECADNSDELLPRCRNETVEIRGKFKCGDGNTIPATNHCDGVRDCADGSDETLRSCAGKTCPSYLFQCAYGACVDGGSDCNKISECADDSDEDPELCGTNVSTIPVKPPQQGQCILPSYPEHGTYSSNVPNARPGDSSTYYFLNVTCRQGYGVNAASREVYCYDGIWYPKEMPQCIKLCHLVSHPSVEYRCIVSGSVEGSRNCKEYEPSGTTVSASCRTPNYYSSTTLPFMRCIDGQWDYVARCIPGLTKNGTNITILIKDTVEIHVSDLQYTVPANKSQMVPVVPIIPSVNYNSSECGTITPSGTPFIIGGVSVKKGEVPWHAGIYTKTKKPYMQECGGSLISQNVVLTAAHCFWNNFEGKENPAQNYAVAVGKLYRPWRDPNDEAQFSDVASLHLPVRFQGSSANYQDDIAVVRLSVTILFQPHIRPVCVDFDITFERRQLQHGNMGKVAGWGLTAANGNSSQVLKVIDIPYIDIQTCISESPPSFREYITGDKICAGYQNAGKALCHGDSGGGLAFPESDKGKPRYYLRGIVSTAPSDLQTDCNPDTFTSFTQLQNHEHFVKQFWNADA